MSSRPFELPPYVEVRLRQVLQQTGYRVAIEEVDLLEFDSEVRYATNDAPAHHIRVSRGFRDHLTHFVLSALVKIERYFAAPKNDQRLPAIDDNGRLPADEEAELRRRIPPEAVGLLPEISNRLYVGLVRQLLSFPLDLRVERELFETLPEHRERQLAYLRRQVADLTEHFSPTIEEFSPPKAYAASSAMNCAFAEFCSALTGERPSRAIRFSPHREKGIGLLQVLGLNKLAGHLGDRAVTNTWAVLLDLDRMFSWSEAT